jgi:translation initiation factor 2 subunit 2
VGYEELLSKAYDKMPKPLKATDRFEVPTVESNVQGSQTMIRNFSQICETLRREPRHLLKFLAKELATPANFDGSRAILQAKIPQNFIQKKLEIYVKEYVLCKECGQPDTKLTREDRIESLKCEACGARTPVKSIK